jgi:hypothetical protein
VVYILGCIIRGAGILHETDPSKRLPLWFEGDRVNPRRVSMTLCELACILSLFAQDRAANRV